jgi:hypothetical protein
MDDYNAKVEAHLDKAIAAENTGNIDLAEKEFKFAAFYEARRLNLDTKEYMASCTPVLS